MAFADSIRTQLASMEGVATLLENLLISASEISGSLSPQNITATSPSAITGATTDATVAAGESVLVLGLAQSSNGTSGKFTAMALYRDTTLISVANAITEGVGDTAGGRFNLVAYAIDTPSAGTYAYNMKGYTQSGGSAYFNSFQMIVMKFRIS